MLIIVYTELAIDITELNISMIRGNMLILCLGASLFSSERTLTMLERKVA